MLQKWNKNTKTLSIWVWQTKKKCIFDDIQKGCGIIFFINLWDDIFCAKFLCKYKYDMYAFWFTAI